MTLSKSLLQGTGIAKRGGGGNKGIDQEIVFVIRNSELVHLTEDRILGRECLGYSPDAPDIYLLFAFLVLALCPRKLTSVVASQGLPGPEASCWN